MISGSNCLEGSLKRGRIDEDRVEETQELIVAPLLKKRKFDARFSHFETMPNDILDLIFKQFVKSNLFACFLVSQTIRSFVIKNSLFKYLTNESMILREIRTIISDIKIKRIKQRVNLLTIKFCFINKIIEDLTVLKNLHTTQFKILKNSILLTGLKKINPIKIPEIDLPSNFSIEKPFDLSTLNNDFLKYRIKKNPNTAYKEIKTHFSDSRMIQLLVEVDNSALINLFNSDWNKIFELLEIKVESAPFGYHALGRKLLTLLFSAIKGGEVNKQLEIEYLKKILTTEYFQTIPFSDSHSESSHFFREIIYFLLEKDKETSLQLAKVLCDGTYSHVKALGGLIIFNYHNNFQGMEPRLKAWAAEEEDPMRSYVFGVCRDVFLMAKEMNKQPQIDIKDIRMKEFEDIMTFYYEINEPDVFGLSVVLSCLVPLISQKVLLNWFDISLTKVERFTEDQANKKRAFKQAFLELSKNPLFTEHELLLHLLLCRFPQHETYEEGSIKNRHGYLNLIGNLDVEAMLRVTFGDNLEVYRKENFKFLSLTEGLLFLRLFMNLLDNPIPLPEKNEKLIEDILINFLNSPRLKDSMNFLYRGLNSHFKPLFQLLAEKKLTDCADTLLTRTEEILFSKLKNDTESQQIKILNPQVKQLKHSKSISYELDLLFEHLDWIKVFRKIKKTKIIPNL